jgi:hypothetical protein
MSIIHASAARTTITVNIMDGLVPATVATNGDSGIRQAQPGGDNLRAHPAIFAINFNGDVYDKVWLSFACLLRVVIAEAPNTLRTCHPGEVQRIGSHTP